MRRLRRILAWVALLLVVGALAAWLTLRASLPMLDGAQRSDAIAAEVTLERDALGIATITAANEFDAAYGLGFAHAQDRFFQMDTARRLAAGELAALVGAAALPQDRKTRVFRFRARVQAWLTTASQDDRRWLDSYARGVNDGLQSLGSRPFEYWLLRSKPDRWQPEDTLLVSLSMTWQLQSSEFDDERFRLALTEVLQTPEGGDVARARAAAIEAMLQPRPVEWDAPMYASREDAVNASGDVPPLPTPEQLDLRTIRATVPASARSVASADLLGDGDAVEADGDRFVGSNNWGLAGRRSATGAALIANDMHLGLGVPAVWYRARIRVAGRQDLNGVSLPGVPTIVAGSNGDIAWGFTNSYGDWIDLRRVGCDLKAKHWQGPDGTRDLTSVHERLAVKGGDPEFLDVYTAGAEVVVESDAARGECTLANWFALSPNAINLNIRELTRARNVFEAVELAPRVAIPQQNLVVGDRDGHLAWTLIGGTPHGPQPAIVDPDIGAVWSANARTVSGEAERSIGGDEWQWGVGYDLGARARQIQGDLAVLERPASPADMLAIQLDDRAIYLARWRGFLLGALDDEAVRNQPMRGELRVLVEQWDQRAGIDSVGYRLLRTFQRRLGTAAWRMLLTALGLDAEQFRRPRRFDATLWRLVNEQPPHLLAGDYADWRAFTLAQVDEVLAELATTCPKLATCRWGDQNQSAVRHPLSRALPLASAWLDMRSRALPGDSDMPRVQAPGFGASERFAVSPGFEQFGYLHIAGGQSGHPLSTYYRAGFDDWAIGNPTPFLPGPARHKLTFSPRTP